MLAARYNQLDQGSDFRILFTPTSGTARVLEQDECPLLLKRLRMGR